MNKKAQKIEFGFFALALLISIGAVIVIINMNLPDVELVGQSTVKAIATQEQVQAAKVFTDMTVEQTLPVAEQELVERRGFNIAEFEGQIFGEECENLAVPIIKEDCFPDYRETYSEIVTIGVSTELQRYDPVNLAQKDVIVEVDEEFNIEIELDQEITAPIKTDTVDYYGVVHTPIPRTEFYRETQNNYIFRPGLAHRNRGTNVVDSIVIHYTGSRNVESPFNYLYDQGFSYHYIVDKDGTIFQFVEEHRMALHAGCVGKNPPIICTNMNPNSIGISLVNMGWGTEQTCPEAEKLSHVRESRKLCWEPYTQEQIDATIQLISEIMSRHPSIPLSREHIVGHDERTTDKPDPGPAFPWDEVMSGLQRRIPLA
ncbi:MAG: N-acetylmuramoyl-L-alanine amidase [Candidatus Woesearchaeota archaeon]